MRLTSNQLRFLPLFLTVFCVLPLNAADFDHSRYDDLLRAYVNSDGLVDYQGLRANSLADLQTYLDQLANADLKGRDYYDKLPFWINAYNANVIKLVLAHPNMKKISEHFEIFDLPLTVARSTYTLNDIEHRIIRGKTNKSNGGGPIPGVTLEIFDPRVHFALVCGAIGCPRLRNFAYTIHNLDATLRENSIDFANSPKYVRLMGGRLRISSIMQWYADDFQLLGGPAAYLSRLIDPSKRKDAEAIKQRLASQYDQAEFAYDWTVNDIRHAQTLRPKLLQSAK